MGGKTRLCDGEYTLGRAQYIMHRRGASCVHIATRRNGQPSQCDQINANGVFVWRCLLWFRLFVARLDFHVLRVEN